MAHHYFLPPAIATTMFAIFLFLSPPTSANSLALDTDGNPLEEGSRYYVLPGIWGPSGGGLTYMPKSSASLCPNYVGQYGFWMQNGNPISFFPANQTQKQVSEGDEVNIAFRPNLLCRESGVWRMTLDNETMIPYVATDGRMRSPGSDFSASWFKIEKSPFVAHTYKIVFCFEVPKPSNINMGGKLKEETCQQLDATQPGPVGVRFLSLVPIDNPLSYFGFVFRKAVTPTTITTTTN